MPGVKPVVIELTDFKSKEVVEELEVDACLVATGRAPYTNGLALQASPARPTALGTRCCWRVPALTARQSACAGEAQAVAQLGSAGALQSVWVGG